ncbi:MAG: hypothetical protein CL912_03685 [Deltaproteobacteria bacterium]|nr:hypothetical protein [Deltaproteobacteria bacterium]
MSLIKSSLFINISILFTPDRCKYKSNNILFLFLRIIFIEFNEPLTAFLKLNSTKMIIMMFIDFLLKRTNYV